MNELAFRLLMCVEEALISPEQGGSIGTKGHLQLLGLSLSLIVRFDSK